MASKSGNGIHLAQTSAHVWCYRLLAVWTYAIAISETLHIQLPKAATEENKIEAFAVTRLLMLILVQFLSSPADGSH